MTTRSKRTRREIDASIQRWLVDASRLSDEQLTLAITDSQLDIVLDQATRLLKLEPNNKIENEVLAFVLEQKRKRRNPRLHS